MSPQTSEPTAALSKVVKRRGMTVARDGLDLLIRPGSDLRRGS
jgi:hypothetical protein